MRITNGMMITNSLNNLNGALTRVARYNNQLASNRKILTLSDSPVGVLNSLGARNQIRRLEQYQRNVDNSRMWIQESESAVTEMEELTHTIRELLTDAMGTENADDKKIFAKQMREYTNTFFELCNSSNGTQFMFGGYNVTQAPFTAERDANGNITKVLYNGLDLSGMNAAPSSSLQKFEDVINGAAPNDTILAKDITWSGKMTAEGSYTVGAAANGTELKLTFSQVEDNKTDAAGNPILTTPAKTYTATIDLAEIYSKYEGQESSAWANKTETINLEAVDADGNTVSFGSITLMNTDQMDPSTAAGAEDAAEKIAQTIQKGVDDAAKEVPPTNTVVSTSVINASATTGSKTPVGMSWTGSIPDTTQKYSMSVTEDANGNAVLNFSNAFGSPYHSISAEALEKQVVRETGTGNPATFTDSNGNTAVNDKFTLNLESYGLGIVSFTSQTLDSLGLEYQNPTGADFAKAIGSAEFVASKVGAEANQHIQFEVGHNIMTDVTFTGIELVGTGEDNLFNMMIDLANMLDNNADNGDLTRYITKITQRQDQLLTAVVKSGNRAVKMDTMVNRYKLDAINYEAKRSNIEDIDQAEVIMQMKYSEAIYKQALAASAQIIQPTLMDFLR